MSNKKEENENNASYVGNFFKLINSEEKKKNNMNKIFSKQIIQNARTILNSVSSQHKKENIQKIAYITQELNEMEKNPDLYNKPEERVSQLIGMLLELNTSSNKKSLDINAIKQLLQMYKEILTLLSSNPKNEAFKSELETKLRNIEAFLSQIQTENISNQDLNTFILELKNYLSTLLNKLSSNAQENRNNKVKRIEAGVERIKELEATLKKAQENLNGKSREIEELKSKPNSSQSNRTELEKAKQDLQSNRTELEKAKQDLESKITELESSIVKLTSNKNSSNRNKLKLQEEINKLQAQLQAKPNGSNNSAQLKALALEEEVQRLKTKQTSLNEITSEKNKIKAVLNEIKTKLSLSPNNNIISKINELSKKSLNSNQLRELKIKLKNILKKSPTNNITNENIKQLIRLNNIVSELNKNNSSIPKPLKNMRNKIKGNLQKRMNQLESNKKQLESNKSSIQRNVGSSLNKKSSGISMYSPIDENISINQSSIPEYYKKLYAGIQSIKRNAHTLPNQNLFIGGEKGKNQYKPIYDENSIIETYYTFLKNISELPIIIKISALTIDELLHLFIIYNDKTHNELVTFTKNNKTINNLSVLESLASFLYIDITNWINDMFTDVISDHNTISKFIGTDKNPSNLRLLREKYFNEKGMINLFNDTLNMNKLLINMKQCKNGQCNINIKENVLSEMENKNYYINIYTYLDIIQNIISKDDNVNQFYKTIFKKATIHTIIYNFFSSNSVDSIQNIISITNLLSSTENLIEKIDKLYLTKTQNNIISYLRIRCDPIYDQIRMYNRRFDIQLNKNNTFIKIGYNHHNFPYYDVALDNSVTLHKNLSTNITKLGKDIWKSYYLSTCPNIRSGSNQTLVCKGKEIPSLSTAEQFIPINYEHKYLLGPFNNIFPPKSSEETITTNNDISERMNEIINLLVAKKPAFIMGYGASGSGKTSSLIYFTKGKTPESRNGVLIALCNKMAKEHQYTNIKIKSYEFYSDPKKKKDEYVRDNIIVKRVPLQEDSEITFNYINEQFVLTNGTNTNNNKRGYNHINTFTDRTKSETTFFENNTPMGELLIHLIDNDRYVKATPNNPNSSRSHSLIIVNFYKGNSSNADNTTLIIGDFAGVENIFDCDDYDTILGFSDAYINGNASKGKFYNTYSPSIPNKSTTNVQSKSPLCNKIYSLPVYDLHGHYKKILGKVYIPSDKRNIILNNTRSPVNPDHQNEISIDQKIELLFNPNNSSITQNQLFRSSSNVSSVISNQQLYENYIKQLNNDSSKLIPKYFEAYLLQYLVNDINIELDVSNKPEEIFNKFVSNKNTLLNNIQIFNYFENMNNSDLTTITNIISKFTSNQDEITKIQTAFNWNNVVTIYGKGKIPVDFSRLGSSGAVQIDNLVTKDKRITNSDKTRIVSPYNVAINNYLYNYYININNLIAYLNGKSNTIPDNFNIVIITFKSNPLKLIENSKHETLLNIEYVKINNETLTSHKLIELISKKYSFNSSNYVYKSIIRSDIINISNFITQTQNLNRTDLIKIFKYLYIATMEHYIEYHCRYYSSIDVCKIRKNEGYMINGTLEETRNIIRNIILEKNKGSIRTIPPFYNECLPYFCINGDCFKESTITNVESTIFNKIKEELNTSYSEMVFCIFMVLNVSPRANNPPPIPYINIYKLNVFYYRLLNNQKISLEKLNNTLNDIYTSITNHFGNKDLYSDKTNVLRNKKEFSDFVAIKKLINMTFERTKNGSITVSNTELKHIYKSIIQNLKDFKELIDKNNAASAIGTLEFLDIVSKYYTTNIMCKPPALRNNTSGFTDLMFKYINTIKNVKKNRL